MLFQRRENPPDSGPATAIRPVVPPIDLAVPQRLSTATFGVG